MHPLHEYIYKPTADTITNDSKFTQFIFCLINPLLVQGQCRDHSSNTSLKRERASVSLKPPLLSLLLCLDVLVVSMYFCPAVWRHDVVLHMSASAGWGGRFIQKTFTCRPQDLQYHNIDLAKNVLDSIFNS